MDYLQNLEKELKDIREKIGALSHYLEFGNHTNLSKDVWRVYCESNILYFSLIIMFYFNVKD